MSTLQLITRRVSSSLDQGDLDLEVPIAQSTPSHKRKQSDALLLVGQLDISPAEIQSAYPSLSPIEQGTAEDLEDGTEGDNDCAQRWKRRLSPLSSCGLIAIFAVLAAVATLHSVRSRTEPSKKSLDDDTAAVNGYEEIGEPIEAGPSSDAEDWIELYRSPERMPDVESRGPFPVDPNVGGLWRFENVCLTNNVDAPKPPESDTSLRGLLYFTRDKKMTSNPKRCVPCSKNDMDGRSEDSWKAASDTDADLGHRCGMKGLHAMFARDVVDYNECMSVAENRKSIIRARQIQSPSEAKQIHFFREPTFVLQFDAHSRENSLFDTLMTYLPHWHKFRNGDDSFPFNSVISTSVQGCLSHSHNWFCEMMHHTEAFGHAKELPRAKESTLYCYKELYYNQPGYQRGSERATKPMMDDFRAELFTSFDLPGPRDMGAVREKDAKLGMKRPLHIALYANDGETGWKNLDALVSAAVRMKRYHGVVFKLVEDTMDEMTIEKQAEIFNLADAVVMASGDHMANAIFASDDTIFAEMRRWPLEARNVCDLCKQWQLQHDN
ncbi:hypothetical protein ACHAXT_006870 [Thalassiosira profunda]